MSRPKISKGPASQYAGPFETIREFHSGEPNGAGGLLALRRTDDGSLVVDLYRLDAGVRVRVDPDRLEPRS